MCARHRLDVVDFNLSSSPRHHNNNNNNNTKSRCLVFLVQCVPIIIYTLYCIASKTKSINVEVLRIWYLHHNNIYKRYIILYITRIYNRYIHRQDLIFDVRFYYYYEFTTELFQNVYHSCILA